MRWLELYKSKLTTAEEAIKIIESNQTVHIHPGCCEPEILVKALIERGRKLENVKIVHLLTLGTADYVKPELQKNFKHISLFTGANTREAVNSGRADYVPIFLYEIPQLFYSGAIPIDISLIHVSPPDEHGFCSYGTGVDITKAATDSAKKVIAQINPNMPRTLGDSFINLNKIDYIVETDDPIHEINFGKVNETSMKIAEYISSLIDDGSTLQMGIGEIPDAVLLFLKNKKDLGIHTEMFSDGIIELVETGVITNEKKTIHRGKIVASFLLGTRKLFDFVDNNPLIELHPIDYTNDPFVISQNEKMVAINSALEVDLTGQVCSDSIGTHIYSGFGGQVDFIRGAARSKGGKPIIALPSTAKNGTISRIVSTLKVGAGVVTTRADVHYIVTEYGIAHLHGKGIKERAKSLINIAHPNFREELEKSAYERKLL
ncbi:4-hydroxybutyrate CoA-transferase [candidate division KSB1 bacterium]|nr:MAG: 4-hydroxybutyrate CoA-transferase [candidate division KSB1 bacterium]